MYKAIISFTFFALSFYSGLAQAPSHLTTDLIEHTDRVFLNGYPSGVSLTELNSTIEPYQTVLIRSTHPLLGWVMNSEKTNVIQSAYRILMASSPELLEEGKADIWDSGKTQDENSTAVKQSGKALKTSSIYFWKVKTWDQDELESEYSHIRSFRTADVLDGKTAVYPLQKTDEYPILITPIKKGDTYIDFGKVAFGQLKLTLTSQKTTDTIHIHLGEHAINGRVDRKPKGSIRYTHYRLPLMQGTHTYLLKIKPDKRNTDTSANESGVKPIFMPDYIGEVYPFRYCEIENYTTPIQTNDLIRQSVHYPFNDSAAYFHSSDSILNKVWELSKYSIKATSFSGIYVDGDRERIPYEADALINQLCHYAVDREFSMPRYSHEYLIHEATWPTEWIMQSVIMAWNDYLYTGNTVSLERYYEDLQSKTLLSLKETNGLISTKTNKQTPELLQSIHFKGKALRDIVDWPQSGVLGVEKSEAGEADGYVLTTYNTVVNAYHYYVLKRISEIAHLLGHQEDGLLYAQEAENVKQQINRLLFNKKKGYYQDGIDTDHASLHANMFPLAFGVAPQKHQQTVMEFIRSRGMACSVYGSQFLLDAVYDAEDAAYGLSLLTSTGERSWYNMIRTGATITTEAWDTKYKPNQDWNHAWGAAPANLIPRKLMGIEPIEPGFSKIRIKPQPGSLHHANIRIPTIRGDIGVSFENIPQQHFSITVEVPANSTAEVWLPLPGKKYHLTINGTAQKGVIVNAFVKVTVGSGKHQLLIEGR